MPVPTSSKPGNVLTPKASNKTPPSNGRLAVNALEKFAYDTPQGKNPMNIPIRAISAGFDYEKAERTRQR
ncbi:MAG: hypothetical protein QNJ58_03435 [Desulfobacterales bacterium]|nr:hypothetical protein [Desulfobacterales bacterium]